MTAFAQFIANMTDQVSHVKCFEDAPWMTWKVKKSSKCQRIDPTNPCKGCSELPFFLKNKSYVDTAKQNWHPLHITDICENGHFPTTKSSFSIMSTLHVTNRGNKTGESGANPLVNQYFDWGNNINFIFITTWSQTRRNVRVAANMFIYIYLHTLVYMTYGCFLYAHVSGGNIGHNGSTSTKWRCWWCFRVHATRLGDPPGRSMPERSNDDLTATSQWWLNI